MSDKQTTLSIRVPLLARAMVEKASEKTGLGIAEYYISAANTATQGILEHEKNLKILPEWLTDERERQMVSMMIDVDELKSERRAAKRLMTPHTRFMIWAVLLAALGDLGQSKSKDVVKEVDAQLNGSS